MNYYIFYKNGAITVTGAFSAGIDISTIKMPEGYGFNIGIADPQTQYVNSQRQLINLTVGQIEIYNDPAKDKTTFNFSSMSYPDTEIKSQAELLEEARQVKWAELKNARNLAEVSPLHYEGKIFDGDLISQQRITGAVQLATLSTGPFNISWTLADNTSVNLNREQLIGLGVKLATRSAALFSYSQMLRTQLEAVTTVNAVKAINWNFQFQD